MADRTDDFRVVAMADQEHGAARLGVGRDFLVHLHDERAGSVDHRKVAVRGLSPHGGRDAMGTEDDPDARRHVLQILDKYHAPRNEVRHDVLVVNDVVTGVDRRPETFQRMLHDLNGARNTGAEPTWIGEHDLHSGSSQDRASRRPDDSYLKLTPPLAHGNLFFHRPNGTTRGIAWTFGHR